MKRSTTYAVQRMKAAQIPCWIETHRRMKWSLAMRIASPPDERWAKKAANWTQASTPGTRQTEQWDDQKRDGKMKKMTLPSQRKLKRRKANNKEQRHMDQSGKNQKKMENNGNRIRNCISNPPQTRNRTTYATNAGNLTFVCPSARNQFERFLSFWNHLADSNSIFLVADFFFERFEILVC